jgi:predicted lipid carrier protein YhbT
MNLPPFTVPKPLAAMISLLPQYPHSLLLTQVLNLALGKVIKPQSLEPLYGKVIRIRVTDAGINFHFTVNSTGFLACAPDQAPELTISATAHDFLLLALRKEDPDTLFFNRRLVVEGDTELGLIAKNTLDGVELPKLDFSLLLPGKALETMASRLLSQAR